MRAGVRVRTIHLATLVIAEGDFDLANVRSLRAALHAAIDAGTPVVIDFTDVTFADSTAVAAIVGAYRRAIATDTPLHVVVPADSRVRKVLDLTGVTAALPVCETIDAALLALVPDTSRTRTQVEQPQAQAG